MRLRQKSLRFAAAGKRRTGAARHASQLVFAVILYCGGCMFTKRMRLRQQPCGPQPRAAKAREDRLTPIFTCSSQAATRSAARDVRRLVFAMMCILRGLYAFRRDAVARATVSGRSHGRAKAWCRWALYPKGVRKERGGCASNRAGRSLARRRPAKIGSCPSSHALRRLRPDVPPGRRTGLCLLN